MTRMPGRPGIARAALMRTLGTGAVLVDPGLIGYECPSCSYVTSARANRVQEGRLIKQYLGTA